MEAVKEQILVFEDGKPPVYEEIKALEAETSSFHKRILLLKTHFEEKSKEAASAESNTLSLRESNQKDIFLNMTNGLKKTRTFEASLQSLEESHGLALRNQLEGFVRLTQMNVRRMTNMTIMY